MLPDIWCNINSFYLRSGVATTLTDVWCTSLGYLLSPVLRVVRSGPDDPPCVLQDAAGPRGARDPVLPGRQAPGRAPVWGEGLQTPLAQPGLGEGEGDNNSSSIGLYPSDVKVDPRD